jgi:uncharacterized protein YegL
MPRLMPTSDTQVIDIPGPGNFQFSAIRPENLGATEYTLVTMVIDTTGSVRKFAKELLDCVKSIVQACQKSPRAENLMLRLITFNEVLNEVHGFKPLSEINVSDYKPLNPAGMTALYDATFSGVASTLVYAKSLIDQDFDVNGCVYIVTDGLDNVSRTDPKLILDKIDNATTKEEIESLITILIGVNDPTTGYSKEIAKALEDFKKKANLTQFVDVGDATPQRLAKLANFVSQSISSQSQALGSGSPSQPLVF